jgi:hypothetical protein
MAMIMPGNSKQRRRRVRGIRSGRIRHRGNKRPLMSGAAWQPQTYHPNVAKG